MENRSRIIERIAKLMALGESDNENEAALAVMRAHKLMMRHNIEMAEVKPVEVELVVGVRVYDEEKRRSIIPYWELSLADGIGTAFGGMALSGRRWWKEEGKMSRTIVFYGVGEDAKIMQVVFTRLRSRIWQMAKERTAEHAATLRTEMGFVPRHGRYSSRVWRESYCRGVVHRLMQRLKDEIEREEGSSETALVLLRNQMVRQHVDDNLKTRDIESKSQQGNFDAFEMGVRDGEGIDIDISAPVSGHLE